MTSWWSEVMIKTICRTWLSSQMSSTSWYENGKKRTSLHGDFSYEYLGHHIDSEGLHATADKMVTMVSATVPKNVHELRSFLELLNYCRKFLPNLASQLQPLNSLLYQGCNLKWTPECTAAFKASKDLILSAKVLDHYGPMLPLQLVADASACGLGAVISHIFPDGSEQPFAFASRTLTPSERNYAHIVKEAFALVFEVQHFHQYLYGR